MRISIFAGLVGTQLAAPLQEALAQDNTIAQAKTDLNNDFVPDRSGEYLEVHGRITADGFSSTGLRIFIQDVNDNAGIQVRGGALILPDPVTFPVGVDVEVYGLVGQENGLRYLNLDFNFDMQRLDAGQSPAPLAPLTRTIAGLLTDAESYEGTFVRITNATITAGNWPAWKSSGSVTISDGTTNMSMYIHNNLDLSSQLAPTNKFNVQGIFAQYDSTTPPDGGYQIWPRAYTDIAQTPYVGAKPPTLFFPGSTLISTGPGRETKIDVIGQDPNSEQSLTLSVLEGPAEAVFTDNGNRTGLFTWTPPPEAAGITTSVVFTVSDGSTTATGTVGIVVLTLEKANIVCNEILWDPMNSIEGDADGDGVLHANKDEFVEILNLNTNAMDLTGWKLLLGTNTLYTFPTFSMTGQTAVVVFGGGTPVGVFGGAAVFSSPTWGGLANTPGDREVRLLDEVGSLVFSHSYRTFGTPDQSITRNPDGTGDFVLHLDADPTRRFSPGTKFNGRSFPGSPITNAPPLIQPIANRSVGIGANISINITATDPDGDSLTLGVSGAPATAIFTDQGDGSGVLAYTGRVEDVGGFTITVTASDGEDSSDTTFTLSVLSSGTAGLVINEFLPDPDATGGIHIDANNDGVTNRDQDEFVEIVNTSDQPVDLTGFMLHDAAAQSHVFSSVTLPPGGHIVVFGGGSIANFAYLPAQLASAGTLSLNNSSESIILFDAQSNLVTRVDYADSFAAASQQRSPEFTGDFLNHYTISGFTRRASPGQRSNGTAFLLNQRPTITGAGDRQAFVDTELSFTVTASEPDGDSVTLSALNLPANATFATVTGNGSVNRTFLFTPAANQAGQIYDVVFRAEDIHGVAMSTSRIEVATGSTGDIWDFEDGLQGWTALSRASNKDWGRLASGAEGSGFKMEINGYTGDSASDDWLISPPLNLDPAMDPALSFWTIKAFTGPDLQFRVSTNYPGTGDPLAAGVTWVDFPIAASASWAQGTNSLAAFATNAPVHVAFHYTTTGTNSGEAARWAVDQIRIVSQIPLSVPTALPASGISPTQFTANWEAVTGATGYQIDVATNALFSAGTGGAVTIDFEGTGETKTAYASGNVTLGGLTWDLTEALIGIDANDFKTGLRSARLRGYGTSAMTMGQDLAGGLDSIAFEYRRYGADAQVDWRVEISTNAGASWAQVGTNFTALASDQVQTFSNQVAVTVPVRVRIKRATETGTATKRLNIDNIQLNAPSASSSFVPGYQSRVVTGTSQAVTNLMAGRTYYYRVRAFNDAGTTSNSPVIEVTTAAGVDPDADDDSDGIPNGWEILHFGSSTGALASDDPDEDGMKNREEYIANTNPMDENSVLEVRGASVDGANRPTFTFPSSAERVYALDAMPFNQLSTPPFTWTPASAEVTGHASGQTTLSDTNTPPLGGVYRIRVRLP